MQPIAVYKVYINKSRWTKREEERLMLLYQNNTPLKKIARKLNRTYSSVTQKLQKLKKEFPLTNMNNPFWEENV